MLDRLGEFVLHFLKEYAGEINLARLSVSSACIEKQIYSTSLV